VSQLIAGLVDDLSEWQRNQFQMRIQAIRLKAREGGQKIVLAWAVSSRHSRISESSRHELQLPRGFNDPGRQDGDKLRV